MKKHIHFLIWLGEGVKTAKPTGILRHIYELGPAVRQVVVGWHIVVIRFTIRVNGFVVIRSALDKVGYPRMLIDSCAIALH